MPQHYPTCLNPDQAQEIAQRYYGEVLAYCRRHAPYGYEAQDLAQEVFVRFVRAQGYKDRGKAIAYLMRVARSVCIDAQRKPHIEFTELTEDDGERNTTVVTFDEYDEDGTWLEAALMKLPHELQEVIELRYGSDLSINEVAHVLGISRFSVHRRINTALKLLKTTLEATQETGGIR